MKKEYNLKFITPCFCAGADGETAELRVPSIRGAIRWWFRLLGGNKLQEENVFGGISKDQGIKSCIVLRVKNVKLGTHHSLSDNNQFFAGRFKTPLNAETTFILSASFNEGMPTAISAFLSLFGFISFIFSKWLKIIFIYS